MKKEKKEKERREQPKQKTDSPMITSAKNYIKEKKTERLNPRINGKIKAIQTKSQKEACTYRLTKREKGRKNIYI